MSTSIKENNREKTLWKLIKLNFHDFGEKENWKSKWIERGVDCGLSPVEYHLKWEHLSISTIQNEVNSIDFLWFSLFSSHSPHNQIFVTCTNTQISIGKSPFWIIFSALLWFAKLIPHISISTCCVAHQFWMFKRSFSFYLGFLSLKQ